MKKENYTLFLGGAAREGVTAKLTATNKKYKIKILDSSLKNWKSILDVFETYNIELVIAKLTNTSLNLFADESYKATADELLKKVSTIPNIFLSHESLLTGERTNYPENIEPKYSAEGTPNFDEEDAELENQFNNYMYDRIFEPPKYEVREHVINKFTKYGIDITPYKYNSELTLIATSFIEQNENNLIFRMYMPTGKIWADEAEKLLHLFRDYLHKISGLEVRQDQYKTNQGVVYELFSECDISPKAITKEFDEFSNLMDMCVANPEQATLLLDSKNLNKKEVFNIVEKYSREARRLHIDIKHERERKILNIKHKLEADLGEHARNASDWKIIDQLVDNGVPKISGVSSSIVSSLPKPNETHITLNINSNVIETVNGVISDEINGDQNLGINEKKLIELINSHAPGRSVELTSAIHEISDKGINETDKLNARQKLKGFALAAKGKAGEIATGLVQTIIENQVGL